VIGRMQKVTVICTVEREAATLLALQQMGALHVEHLREPGGAGLAEARAHRSAVRRACEVLEHQARRRGTVAPGSPAAQRSARALVEEIERLVDRRKDCEESLEFWRREIARVEPFGSFDPSLIHQLEKRHLHVYLCKADPKRSLEAPGQATITVHRRDRHGVYFSVVSRTPLALPYEAIELPGASVDQMRDEVRGFEAALVETERTLEQLTGELPRVRELLDEAEDVVQLLEVRAGMGSAPPLAYLQGYCPKPDLERVRAAAAELGWGLVIEDVQPTDRVPTRIESPRWVRPIRSVFRLIGVVPGYGEVDISAVFLLFFSLFFAMIVGDAGYGALLLAATFWAQRRFTRAPVSVFHLLYITGAATILWGLLIGNYFGVTALPPVLSSLRMDWLSETDHLMSMCFLIGAVHLTIAHAWGAVRRRGSWQALAQVGWICVVWAMFFLARHLVLDGELPMLMVPVFAVGVVLVVLFMTPARKLKDEWFTHAMLPLQLVANFVDVVSYLRLFAVGTATLAVASAFNHMAIEVGATGWVGTLVAVLILVLGHTLNLALAAMGVLVHGIRLNTLEFAGHLGLQWTGIPFAPFMLRARSSPVLDDRMSESRA
jgi:V/A-type H+/Na+-transporting ATPase subunit I